MLQIGDLTVYQEHGICRVDDICDKTFGKNTRRYYVLHPIDNSKDLTLNIPVDNGKSLLFRLIDKEEAENVLQSFYSDGVEWIERPHERARVYDGILNSGDRIKIAKVANTLIRRKWEVEKDDKKLHGNDRKLLTSIINILFKEMAMALGTSVEAVKKDVKNILATKK